MLKNIAIFFVVFVVLLLGGCHVTDDTIIGQFSNNNENIKQDLFSIEGTRPLILIMANVSSPIGDLQDKTVYQEFYSNRFTYNAQDYLHQVSYGKFTFSFQGVYGPYNISNEEPTNISTRIAAAIQSLHEDQRNEIDLKQFDINNDNVLTTNELMIVVVDNVGLYGGAVRGVHITLSNDLTVSLAAAVHGSHANLATITHEITHLIGTIDLYGANCNSTNLTLMSCTIFSRPGNDTVHLDPWHKMNLGWIEPRFVSIQDINSKDCYGIEVPQYDGYEPRLEQRPLLIYDPGRSPYEYFLIEFRNAFYRVADPELFSYDENVPGVGVVIWSVRVDENGYPLEVPSLIRENAWDTSIWTFGSTTDIEWSFVPEEMPSRYSRSSYVWSSGYVIPRYQDGVIANFSIDIKNFNEQSAIVEICIESLSHSQDYSIDASVLY